MEETEKIVAELSELLETAETFGEFCEVLQLKLCNRLLEVKKASLSEKAEAFYRMKAVLDFEVDRLEAVMKEQA